MSCLFPAYVSTDNQQQNTVDGSIYGRESAPDAVSSVCVTTKDVAPQWLENPSFKSDDAILLHQRHLGYNQTNKSEDSDGEPKQPYRERAVVSDVKKEDDGKVNECQESHNGKVHKKKSKTKRRHSSESLSRKDYRKKHKSDHFSGTTDSEGQKKKHRILHSPSPGSDDRKKYGEDQGEKNKKESRESGSKRKHKHKHRHRRDRHDEDRTKRREKDKKQEKESQNMKPDAKKMIVIPPGKVFIDDIKDLSPEDAFRVDRKPDKVNAEYESIYKMNVAKYRCPKYCLGQSSSQFFVPKGQCDNKSKSDHMPDRYFSKNKLKLIYDDQNVLDLNIDKTSKNSEKFREPKSETSDYIEITKTKPEKSEYNPLGVYDQKTAMYIQGVGVAAKEVDPPAESSVEGNFKETLSESLKRQTEEFSRSLREKPYDIQMWLDFVKFQDKVLECEMAVERDSGAKSNKGKKQVFLVEKKQAVIDKALQKNPNNVKLQLTKLELHSDVWDSDTMMKEWETLVLSHIGDVTLWKEFLLFVQSSFSRFSVLKVIKQYTRCMRTLRDLKLRKPKYQHVAVPKDIDQHILGIFLQFCYFLKQAGYAEKSIALFQAMIEFNHFMPAVLHQTPWEEQVALFEPFWDSCVPRFGDEGAIGWSTWILDKSTNFPPPLVSAVDEDDDDILDKTLPRNQNWLAVEKRREGRFWLPWRPDITKGQGQQDCEDPDRLVLIDDITDFLVTFSGDVKQKLVLSFFSFLGISDLELKDSVGNRTITHKPIQELPNQMCCPKSSESLDFYPVLTSFLSLDDSVLQSFATELFKQVCKLLPAKTRRDVMVAWMTFEINRMKRASSEKKLKKQLYKEVKKFCKSVLHEQSNRSCLELWELYGRFEWCYGNVVDARKVFDMAIGMHCRDVVKLESVQQLQAVKLCFTYCELVLGLHEPRLVLSKKVELCQTQVTHVLYILTCLIGAAEYAVPSDEKTTTAPQMLKAKKSFVDFWKGTLDNFLSALQQNQEISTLGELVTIWTECYALYQYLGQGIKAAAVVMEETIDKIKPFTITKYTPGSTSGVVKSDISTFFEKLHISYIKLLTFHLSTTYAPLSILRSPLMRGLQLFPDNPCLLSTFIEMEASSHIAGRVRKYFDHCAVSGAITNWFFAIHAELLRRQSLLKSLANGDQVHDRDISGKEASPDLGIANRIRSLFEKATTSQDGKKSILLWRMFVHFEVSEGDQSRARAVFYRALQHCPWAKSLYMDGVSYFSDDFQDVTDLMTEKEIRVRCLPEELDILLEEEEHQGEPPGDGS